LRSCGKSVTTITPLPFFISPVSRIEVSANTTKRLAISTRHSQLRKIAGDYRGIATTLSEIARLERDRGNLVEARQRIEEALAQVELVRLNVADPKLRTSFFASVQQYREFYIDLLMRLNKNKPSDQLERVAFNASETGRARSLLQLLSEAGRIRESNPQFTALLQPVPLKLDEIQQKILDRDTLLLEYSLGEERSFVFAVTPDSIKTFELPKCAVIESVARRVYELLTARADAEYAKASATLSRLILGPVAA
jgi:hypothetical protein